MGRATVLAAGRPLGAIDGGTMVAVEGPRFFTQAESRAIPGHVAENTDSLRATLFDAINNLPAERDFPCAAPSGPRHHPA